MTRDKDTKLSHMLDTIMANIIQGNISVTTDGLHYFGSEAEITLKLKGTPDYSLKLDNRPTPCDKEAVELVKYIDKELLKYDGVLMGGYKKGATPYRKIKAYLKHKQEEEL